MGMRAADRRRNEPFRHLLESVKALEEDRSIPLPVLFEAGQRPAPTPTPPPGAAFADDDEDETVADLNPHPEVVRANLLATHSSAPPRSASTASARPPAPADVTHASDERSIDIGAGEQRLLRAPTLPGGGFDISLSDLDEEVLADVADDVAVDLDELPRLPTADEETDRRLPAYAPPATTPTFVSADFASSTGDGILTQLAEARAGAASDGLSAIPSLQPLTTRGPRGALAVSQGMSTRIWQKNATPDVDEDQLDNTATFDALLDGPDAWFDLPSDEPLHAAPAERIEAPFTPPPDELEAPFTPPPEAESPLHVVAAGKVEAPFETLPVVQGTPVRPLPSRARGTPVKTHPGLRAPGLGAAPRRSEAPAQRAARPHQGQLKVVARKNLGAEFYERAVAHVARGEYADALARLAAAHNLEPDNTRYTLLIEDIKRKL